MIAATAVSEGDVRAIVGDIVTTYLPASGRPSNAQPASTWIEAHVEVSGAWNGDVALAVWGSSAPDIAAAMLQLSREDVTVDDSADALCELVNMIGGQVKSLLPGECKLSLPLIRMRREGAPASGPAMEQLCSVEQEWDGHLLKVIVSAR